MKMMVQMRSQRENTGYTHAHDPHLTKVVNWSRCSQSATWHASDGQRKEHITSIYSDSFIFSISFSLSLSLTLSLSSYYFSLFSLLLVTPTTLFCSLPHLPDHHLHHVHHEHDGPPPRIMSKPQKPPPSSWNRHEPQISDWSSTRIFNRISSGAMNINP